LTPRLQITGVLRYDIEEHWSLPSSWNINRNSL